ncbi:alginate export family protein [Simiduia curdlanivorans]|uniref:Alginate export family protein n=1 Tax=Simiduia curdlanivorans TaxID=1492769 RepID=A0ABV8V3M2_9GAMM|nr:alginate export family protein [Simiduia curdlanivorans]MDN3638349.1 alginate export family protein [Simiduia curdlanivorans]
MKKVYLSLAIAAAASSPYALADSALETFMKESKTNIDFRYRFESVEQDGIDKDAVANTLRSRLSFVSGNVSGFSLGLEFDDVHHLGDDNFNSTSNGNSTYPVVADPDGTDINQFYAKYVSGSFAATGGRQRINLDDQRFVGGVAWRQNEQTYDGARLQFGSGSLSGEYSYVSQVNRIFGPEGANATLDGDVHLLNAAWSLSDAQKVVGFYYDMDFENAAAASNQTYGLRYEGKFKPASVIASYAAQSEAGDGAEYSTDYYLLEAKGVLAEKFNWTVGYEVLGSDDGAKGFQTPLATGHKFQGFADKFLGTPANGVEDAYIGAGANVGPLKLALTYHDFKAAEGSANYGTEWDAVIAYPINKQVTTLLKFADYQAKDYASDTQKIWLQVQISL